MIKSAQIFALFICSVMIISGCATVYDLRETERASIPRSSFVEIKAVIKKSVCKNGVCKYKVMSGLSSGVVIKKNNLGSYVLGAEHACAVKKISRISGNHVKFMIVGASGKEYASDIIMIDKQNDICVFFVKGMKHVSVVKMRDTPPKYGERVYNLASPLGTAYPPTTIPVFVGHYSGFIKGLDVYTIPAKGGSSGSPILDTRGQLLGMLVGHHRGFNQISVSPRFSSIKRIVNKIKSYKISHGDES